jgi:hypothetical protein
VPGFVLFCNRLVQQGSLRVTRVVELRHENRCTPACGCECECAGSSAVGSVGWAYRCHCGFMLFCRASSKS